jgi:spermine oxidase
MNYATQDSSVVSESFVDQTWSKIDNLFDQVSLVADSLNANTDKSLLSILDPNFKNLLKKLNANAANTPLITAIYGSRLKEEIFNSACSNLSDLSALGWNRFLDSARDQEINLKSGYIGLINTFKSVIGDSNIYLNESVSQIQYPTSGGITGNPIKITSMNTVTGVRTVHEADYVLTTFPLGYLKSNYKSLFVPSLPSKKANAIEKLGFGTINKFWLVFDSVPLGSDGQGISVLWRNDLPNLRFDSAKQCGFRVIRLLKIIFSLTIIIIKKFSQINSFNHMEALKLYQQ